MTFTRVSKAKDLNLGQTIHLLITLDFLDLKMQVHLQLHQEKTSSFLVKLLIMNTLWY